MNVSNLQLPHKDIDNKTNKAFDVVCSFFFELLRNTKVVQIEGRRKFKNNYNRIKRLEDAMKMRRKSSRQFRLPFSSRLKCYLLFTNGGRGGKFYG